jgi:hypothetical protein
MLLLQTFLKIIFILELSYIRNVALKEEINKLNCVFASLSRCAFIS